MAFKINISDKGKSEIVTSKTKEAIIVINDVGDHRQSSFRVNISDLVLKAKAA